MREDESVELRRALVVTALRIEYKAVRAHLRSVIEDTHPQGTVYEIGGFPGQDGSTWNVCIVETGPGNAAAATQTERAINYFNPKVVLFVGIAGGLKDVSIGDVVAATKVYGYESGKAEREFHTRPEVYRSSHDLEQRARAEARREDWLASAGSATRRGFEVLVAPIASGEKVIASRQSALCQFICSQYSDAVAVEMEGMGFLVAAAANFDVRSLVVRGISDLLDRKSETDALGSQRSAADHASAFAFQVLSKLNSKRADQTANGGTPPPGKFVRDPRIDALLTDVRFGDLKSSSQPALEILRSTDTVGRNELFEKLLNYQDCSDDEDVFWKALGTMEGCCELAPWLIDRPVLVRMASHKNFSVRSSAAFMCMNLAQYAPELVPVDVLVKLSVHDEDWYVEAPANAALKAMARAMPAVLHIFFERLRSPDPQERAHAASALADIAEKEPGLLDAEQLRSELWRLQKLGDRDALAHLKEALPKVEHARRADGYRYGI